MARIRSIFPLIAFLASLSSASALEAAPEGAFSIVVLPDTQGYMSAGNKATADSPGPITNSVFEGHTRWIADNIEAQHIVFVSHVGDVVDKNVDAQWAVATSPSRRLVTGRRCPYAYAKTKLSHATFCPTLPYSGVQ